MFATLKNTAVGMFTIVRSMWMVNSHALRPRDTILYPEQPVPVPPRFRGRKAEREDGRWYPEFFRINFSRCVFCGMCEEACPTTAIQLTPDFELGEYDRQNLVYEKEHLLISGPGKYPDYNYHRITGMAIADKPKGSHQNEAEPVNVRSLLP